MPTSHPALQDSHRRKLLLANCILLLVIVIHDLDHVRQARNWCYTIPGKLWLINLLAYVPNGVSLLLSWLRRTLAAPMTAFAGILIAAEFTKVHLWKPTFPVWGIWNRNFFLLQVDAGSWSILAFTVITALGVSITGVQISRAVFARSPALS